MTDYPTEDRLMDEIQAEAAKIRMITGTADSFGADAWSKAQLMRMLSDVQWHVEKILTHTGVADIEAFYIKCIEAINPANPGDAHKYRPYSDEEG